MSDERKASIDPRFVVNLKGKDFPVYGGVLDAATKSGLKSLRTTVLQVPTKENGGMAIVMATAEFEDGRIFEDVGDCSPATTSPQLAAAALRLASTRAKGRVLRDSVNCGMTLLEELPDEDAALPTPAANGRGAASSGPPAVRHSPQCETCGVELPGNVYQGAMKKFGRPFCIEHGKAYAAALRAEAEAAAVEA